MSFIPPLIHVSLKCIVIQFVFRRTCCVLASLLGMRYTVNKPDKVTVFLEFTERMREGQYANYAKQSNLAITDCCAFCEKGQYDREGLV